MTTTPASAPQRPQAPSKAPWQAYAEAKRAWLNQHPDASADEIEAAMRRIAEEFNL